MQKARIIKIIILIILLLSVNSLVFFKYFYSSTNLTANIYQNGLLLYSINLEDVTESYEITISDANNKIYNIIQVEPEAISIKDASCPDHICVKTGKINSPLLPITCLPNKVVIRITSDNNNDLDSVTH